MFLSEYILAKGAAGEARADLKLAVDAARKTISGSVTITQPVSPPLDVTVDINGWFVPLKHEIVAFVNTAPAPVVGRPEFRVILTMPRWGADGEGAFTFNAGSTMVDSGPVPAKHAEIPATVNA
jgi:uncharacterized protein DUF1842